MNTVAQSNCFGRRSVCIVGKLQKVEKDWQMPGWNATAKKTDAALVVVDTNKHTFMYTVGRVGSGRGCIRDHSEHPCPTPWLAMAELFRLFSCNVLH